MKRLLPVVAVAIVLALVIIGCAKTTEPSPDIPRYTADQVINVASANSPTCMYSVTTPSWTSEYIGNGTWLVTKKCITKWGAVMSTEQWNFYENTGKLTKR